MDWLFSQPWLILAVSLLAGLGAIFLIDHFRGYVLDGSHDPLKITSLRYLQFSTALLTLAVIGLLIAGIGLVLPLTGQTPSSTMTAEAMETSSAPVTGEETPQITPTESAPTPVPSSTPARTATIGNTGGAGANMRTTPSTTSTIITSVNDGTLVTLLDGLETADGFTWQLIAIPDGRQGWVVNSFLLITP